MGERQRRNLWTLLPRRGAVACGGGASPVAQSDGAGDDLLHAGDLLVSGRGMGRVLARLDLVQHRARSPPPSQRRRTEDRRGRGPLMGTRWRSGTPLPAAARAARLQGRGPMVL